MTSAHFQACARFFRAEAVLCVSVLLALVSTAAVPPSSAYLAYIDWDTLSLLFSLMAVMKGFQRAGLFVFFGGCLLRKTSTSRQMLMVLVFLPFFCSMVITNDVSLITFVPFGLIVLRMAAQERLAVPLVILQTLAANLGSMLTPMGNPQNLYLYGKSGISFGELCGYMLPYVLLSGVLLTALILMHRPVAIPEISLDVPMNSPRLLTLSTLGFIICLLGIFKLVSPTAIAAVILIFLLLTDRALLREIDYSLLGTFLALFIFIGNLGAVAGFQNLLSSLLDGHVELVAVLTSQVISNVPAALLLSGFTTQWKPLIVGCNLGGLGTLIASMASLISYKMVAREYPGQGGRYLLWFTLSNLILLFILLAVSCWL